MKTIGKFAAWSIVTACLALTVSSGIADAYTADSYQITRGQDLYWKNNIISTNIKEKDMQATSLTADSENQFKADLMLWNTFPIKSVDIAVTGEKELIPCGTPFGIRLFTNGVIVVGTADIPTQDGMVNPATCAGIKTGDIIQKINGKNVNQNEEVAALVEKSDGKALELELERNGRVFTATLHPVTCETDNLYKAGLWVRDSTAGIGTMTFYDPETGSFGGLGHAICDTDTGEVMPLRSGDILPVTICGIAKGEKGLPGELRGYFSNDTAIGSLCANVQAGVYGNLEKTFEGTSVTMAMKQDITTGKVQILTTINEDGPQYYDAEIESIDLRNQSETKNMVLHVTDPELLKATGGIVQGMSGSPILQNGKLVGAVTHVFVNDPTRGYGIFAENMLNVSQIVNPQAVSKDAA